MKRISLIFLFLSSVLNSQINSGHITYGEKIININIDTTKISSSNLKNILTSQYIAKKEALESDVDVYDLTYNKKEAIFKPIRKLLLGNSLAYKYAISNGIYYTNLSEKKLKHQYDTYGELFLITYDTNDYQWLITNETKIINKYKCQKAVLYTENTKKVKSKIIAWFTNEIPLSFGPKSYSGLPGLILELTERGHLFYVRNISFKAENINIKAPKKGISVSIKEFENIGDDLIKKRRRKS